MQDISRFHSVQTATGAHTVSCPFGTGSSFPGVKVAEAWSWALTSILCRVRQWWSYYISTPLYSIAFNELSMDKFTFICLDEFLFSRILCIKWCYNGDILIKWMRIFTVFYCSNEDSNWITFVHRIIHRMLQESRSIFWEVIVSVILSKEVCMYMRPIPNGFRDSAIPLWSPKTVDKREILRVLFLIPIYIVQVTKLVQFL
jgi:hypothetical protein